MTHPAVETFSLTNRLGQPVTLGVKFLVGERHDTLFVSAPRQQASSFFGKNAESFLVQLMTQLSLKPTRLQIIELRGDPDAPEFWRWRAAEWVGASPVALTSEPVRADGPRSVLNTLLAIGPQTGTRRTEAVARG